MVLQTYCGDFEGGCPGRREPCSCVTEGEEPLARHGDPIFADHKHTSADEPDGIFSNDTL